MQVKQESPTNESLATGQPPKSPGCTASTDSKSTANNNSFPLQDMQCFASSQQSTASQQQQEKSSSPYSLWADYFESFPTQTEFDLRSGVNDGTGSTGSSIASSSSSPAASDSWSSPESGSPFSDCDPEDSPFTEEHSVPTSVIDEIVQTLIMDGYNFDHLGDGLLDTPHTYHVKQEHDMSEQQCYSQNPVYASLTPPKLQLNLDSSCQRKYSNNVISTDTSSNMNMMNNNNCIGDNNLNSISIFDQVMDGKWCNSTTPLPPMSISLQQIQQHTTQQQHQHHNTMHTAQQHQQHQLPQCVQIQHPQHLHESHQPNLYAHDNLMQDSTMNTQYSSAMFPSNYTAMPTNNNNVQQYKYMANSPTSMQSLPPLVQACEKSTTTKPRRRRSNNSQHGARIEKPHRCGECGAAFKLSANLKQHQVIHTGEKPFSCEICKAVFTRLSSLKTHHRLHTGEKPHICPFCSAAFADRSAMKAHKRIHTGERPYKCGVCNTSFTQLSHLNAHKRTHTGEKPYACSICGTTFKQLGHLKRHEKSHVCSRV